MTFAGDAVFTVGVDHPEWHNGFEHDPEEAERVRVSLLRELAANREECDARGRPDPKGLLGIYGDDSHIQ